jgi:RHH-type rel operon transcriptional repressor/antitoxin RelB
MATASALISVRVPTAIADRLENLAKTVDRSKSYLAAEAIEEYLDIHEWQVQAIQAGLREIEQGRIVDFAEVKEQWGKA